MSDSRDVEKESETGVNNSIKSDNFGENREASERNEESSPKSTINDRTHMGPRPAEVDHSGAGFTFEKTRFDGISFSPSGDSCDIDLGEMKDSTPCRAPLDDVGLLYYNRKPLRLKNFASEVRAPMDVEQFAHQSELLLDPDLVSMEEIIHLMLVKILDNEEMDLQKASETRAAIFVGGSSMLLAQTIQGVLQDADGPSSGHENKLETNPLEAPAKKFEQGDPLGEDPATQTCRRIPTNIRHDQSWLCAVCNIAQLKRRHMAIARFKQPMNMGENARHVRLFVLIVVPSKEKNTKDELETGRTFATMFTDSKFRASLMRAKNELEFKSLMMIRAQQLSNAKQLKNRHKYIFDVHLHHSICNQTASKDVDGLRRLGGQLKRVQLIDNASESSPVFNKNPRTSKLFELISSTSDTTQGQSGGPASLAMVQLSEKLDEKIKLPFAAPESCKDPSNKAGNKSCKSGLGRKLLDNMEFGKSCLDDFTRRLRYYPSDFRDAFVGPPNTIRKTVSTIWFLYFGILLPTIAFSSLNTTQTHGKMGDLRKALIGQAIGGLGFALLSGQPLVIVMTTAPLCLYTKAMYAAVGLWNGFFLILYSMFGFSRLMKWCTRSTEEVFALFIVIAFLTDAGKDMMKTCAALNDQTIGLVEDTNHTSETHFIERSPIQRNNEDIRSIEEEVESTLCRRETSLLFVLLMLGTVWLSVTLYRFRKTQYLNTGLRDILSDYALPITVVSMSLIGSTVFKDIYVEKFPPLLPVGFERAQVESLPISGLLTSCALGFTLSLLFFMDQNISAAMVNAPQNRLKKGDSFHYDLLVVALLNGFLTLYGLPMMHGVLPHSPLHARSLADIEEQVEEGHVREVVINARETRVTAIVAHLLLFGSLLLIPYPIAYIPRAVLNGLFLYMAITSLDGLQVFERIMLLFTEQRKIHQFTLLQLVQLLVMCFFGFSPINVVEMFFPVIILLMIPFRHRIVPKYISENYLDALDGKH